MMITFLLAFKRDFVKQGRAIDASCNHIVVKINLVKIKSFCSMVL